MDTLNRDAASAGVSRRLFFWSLTSALAGFIFGFDTVLLFNIGIEIGQLMFIAAVVGGRWILMHLPQRLPEWTRWVPPYAIGSFAAFWLIERLHAALT